MATPPRIPMADLPLGEADEHIVLQGGKRRRATNKQVLANAVTKQGEQGPAGKSAYEIAKSAGFAGTEAQWLASLKGSPGSPSTVAGPAGASAYETAKAAGFSGTEAQWLASLKGAPGAASTVAGPPGSSAYDVAKAAGFTGTQAEWLASLKGAKGDTGKDAAQIQRAIVTTLQDGTFNWTFPTAYPSGTTPVCSADVQDASADTVTVKITAVSNTSMTVKATKPVIVLTLLNTQAAASVKVHVTAMAPT